MKQLEESGWATALRRDERPLLGICLGMQLLFEYSEESDVACLGLIPGHVERLPAGDGLVWPHMGWNSIENIRPDPLTGALDGKWFYFVHSYAAPVGDWTLSSSTHGTTFSAIVRQANFCGAQFHPERSAGAGAQLLRNFLESSAA